MKRSFGRSAALLLQDLSPQAACSDHPSAQRGLELPQNPLLCWPGQWEGSSLEHPLPSLAPGWAEPGKEMLQNNFAQAIEVMNNNQTIPQLQ